MVFQKYKNVLFFFNFYTYPNIDDASGTGVLFTRNPNTGARELFGEYLVKAQVIHGEGVGGGGQSQDSQEPPPPLLPQRAQHKSLERAMPFSKA